MIMMLVRVYVVCIVEYHIFLAVLLTFVASRVLLFIGFSNQNDITSMGYDGEGGNIMGEGGGNDCLLDGDKNHLNYIDRFRELDAGLLACALAKVGEQANLGLLFDSLRNCRQYWNDRQTVYDYEYAKAIANAQAEGLTSVESHPIQEHMEYGKACTRVSLCWCPLQFRTFILLLLIHFSPLLYLPYILATIL